MQLPPPYPFIIIVIIHPGEKQRAGLVSSADH